VPLLKNSEASRNGKNTCSNGCAAATHHDGTPARAPKIWISGLLACAALCGRDLERAIRFLRKLRALSLSCTVPVPTPTSRAHQCIISVIAQAIATTMTRITIQNLIGIRASLRCVTLGSGFPTHRKFGACATPVIHLRCWFAIAAQAQQMVNSAGKSGMIALE
jgi:hypothetical protein